MLKAAAFSKPRNAPYPDPGGDVHVVAASNNWWKQWFEDEVPLIDHLKKYPGRVTFHIGEIDSQNSGKRQYAFGQARISSGTFLRAPRLVFHVGRGHSLRSGEPTIGPMDEAARACLVTELEQMISTE